LVFAGINPFWEKAIQGDADHHYRTRLKFLHLLRAPPCGLALTPPSTKSSTPCT
jgi:hypothetical protein